MASIESAAIGRALGPLPQEYIRWMIMSKLHRLPSEIDKEDHWRLMEFLEIDAAVINARAELAETARRTAQRNK